MPAFGIEAVRFRLGGGRIRLGSGRNRRRAGLEAGQAAFESAHPILEGRAPFELRGQRRRRTGGAGVVAEVEIADGAETQAAARQERGGLHQ